MTSRGWDGSQLVVIGCWLVAVPWLASLRSLFSRCRDRGHYFAVVVLRSIHSAHRSSAEQWQECGRRNVNGYRRVVGLETLSAAVQW